MAEAQLVDGLNDLARRVESEHDLDDLVIPEASRKALVRLISWQTASADVLDVWGLGAVFNKRRSTVALFKGPSGTGKSMAAGIVGKALGLPVFRVDLAAMISKYIGETEKNLERLFRAAEGTDIVLFFDEADAIFGQRSEVSDSHDRYANLETSYLLQRLEAFDGISILATNLAQNMDAAFLRRIDIVIDFPAPSADHRRTLWGRIARTKAPLGADVDLDYLAERFELTGAEIRNCWLDAAHRAATGKPPITMPHLMQAIAGELTKQGKPLRKADFGNHYACLRGGRP
jgi:SpoVK/Ycf46/Vps4 family AAA+-type ATPase